MHCELQSSWLYILTKFEVPKMAAKYVQTNNTEKFI